MRFFRNIHTLADYAFMHNLALYVSVHIEVLHLPGSNCISLKTALDTRPKDENPSAIDDISSFCPAAFNHRNTPLILANPALAHVQGVPLAITMLQTDISAME